jgi:two-component system OmpR family response regulator
MATPLKVLHVDDCDDVRTVVGLTLSSVGGMQVTQSASGPEAIEAVANIEPDLLLLDVMMPEITGPELLSYLRSMPRLRDTPAVFLTAKAAPEDIEKLMKAGAAAVITKPFDAMKLPEHLTRILEDYRASGSTADIAAE